MNATPDFSTIAALIGDPARAAMLSALMGDIALPAGELADQAKITRQTASTHLAKLVQGGLLSVTTMGRHRYFRLSNKDVARALEALSVIAPASPVQSLADSLAKKEIRHARTCYDHLAGELGIQMTQSFINKGFVQPHDEIFLVTPSGEAWLLLHLDIDCRQLQGKHRLFAPACLDWSERKPHIAGALGAAVAQRLFALKWIVRIRGSRAVKVTDSGRSSIKSEFGFEWK